MPARPAPARLVAKLQAALVERDVTAGFALLDASLKTPLKLDLAAPHSIPLLLCIAQWVDLGYASPAFFSALAESGTQVDRARLPLSDFLQLRLAESYSALSSEQVEQCISTLDLVLRTGEDVLPPYHLFLTHFWKGRAHRKRGDYVQAQTHILAARSLAEQMRAPKLVAVTKIHESWLRFQKGNRSAALQLLAEAEKTLRPTGHALSLGNIESARGRFVRRSGEYTRALAHFEAAITIYNKGCPDHPNHARALVNAAYVKRLIALDLQSGRTGGQALGAAHAKALQISREALALLEQARRIYAHHHHQGGTGSVLVNVAHIHLESGDIEQASAEALRALTLGNEKSDQILMARARIALSGVELDRADEQVGEQSDIALHATLAVQHADVAIELALQTQNNRLLAEAYIARGFAAAADYFQEWSAVKEYAAKASALLSSDDRDHLYKLLRKLKANLLGATRIDETLRLWADGQFGGKTFQQIQEEFAELVIPRVWLNCGRNVSLVSKHLRISPKKVRRLLRKTNLQETEPLRSSRTARP